MERLDVLVAVLDGNAVAESDALGLVVPEPLRRLPVDEEPPVLRGVGLLGERGQLVRTVDDDDGAVLHLRAAEPVQHFGRDVRVGLGVDVDVDGTTEERRERELRDAGPFVIMMIRTLAVRTQMAGEIHYRVEVGNRASRVESVKVTSPRLRLRIELLGQVDDPETAHFIDTIHRTFLLNGGISNPEPY